MGFMVHKNAYMCCTFDGWHRGPFGGCRALHGMTVESSVTADIAILSRKGTTGSKNEHTAPRTNMTCLSEGDVVSSSAFFLTLKPRVE